MKLIEAQREDWKILLDWRNDQLTRENSLTSHLISEEEHKKWYFNSLENPIRKIYLVELNGEKIGTVRADTENNEIIISWTVAPAFRGKNLGKEMVKLLVDKLNGKIVAIIKENNFASIKIAEFAGLCFEKKEKNLLYYTLIK